MRQIKFRAWDIKNNCYVGKNWHLNFSDKNIIFDDNQQFRIEKQFIVEQFTGLKDKNGKDIYEGDLVSYGVNKALEIGFGWGDDAELYGESYGVLIGSSVFCGSHRDCEVIGNIYENKDLIK